MWKCLRNGQLEGHRFYRQFVIGPFIVDFCCRKKGLIVELDGAHHRSPKQRDEMRTEYLNSFGYVVLRFLNREIFEDLERVIGVIRLNLRTLPVRPHPGPLPEGRGGKTW
jgi:very-short-patch-repair endonuclease